MKYGIVTVADCFLLEEGKPDSEISDEIFSGWCVSWDEPENENGFLEITTHYGYKGFVPASGIAEISLDELKRRQDKTRFKRINRPAADVLGGPSVQEKLKTTILKNSIVEVIAPASTAEPATASEARQAAASEARQAAVSAAEPEAMEEYTFIRTADGTEGYVHTPFLSERLDDDGHLLGQSFDAQPGLASALADEQGFRRNVVASAKRFLGTQYRWGGKSAQGLDCSGLVFMAYMENGVLIWRDAKLVEGYPMHAIEKDALQPGDLIFFPGHVAMYIGANHYIHSTGFAADAGVRINSFSEHDADYRADLVPKVKGCASLFPASPERRFENRLSALPGNISFCYKNLNTGKTFSSRPEADHIAASVIKLFLMAFLFDGFEKGVFSPEDRLPVPADMKVPSCGVLYYEQDIREMTVRDLITLMIIVSDNTATNLLFDYAGGADRINAFIQSLGITGCSFNRKMFDSEAAARGIENHITASGVAALLEMMYRGTLVSGEASERMLAILSDQRLNGKIPFLLGALRPKVRIAHKTGEDGGTTHDAGIIWGEKAPFVLVFLGNDTDTSAYESIMAEIAMELFRGDET